MKLIKKVIYVVLITIIAIFTYTLKVEAATVEVTEDVLNLRKEASTSSKILTTLSKGTECEFIEEDGDWYKVKYKNYTGYVSSQYTKLIEEESTDNNVSQDVNENGNNKENNDIDTTLEESTENVTGKLSKETSARLLPLINSTVIETLKKNTKVTIITEMNGWAYISTEEIAAWIRSDSIIGKESTPIENEKEEVNSKEQIDNAENNEKFEQKTMYTNDSYINVRKKASTSSEVVMVLALNTKLTVIGEEGDWYKVKTSEGEAYVSKALLSDKEIKTTSRGTVIRGATENITIKELTQTTTNKTQSTSNKTTTTVTNNISSKKGEEIVEYAKKFLNVPYVYGGATPKGFDCSGFTMYVYKNFGISMKHGAQAQAKLGTTINANKNSSSSLKQNLKPGDLVFFLDYETMDEIGHCGIYIGDGKFIHASSGSGYCVKINSLLPGEYYNTRYCGARRVI